MVQSAPAQTTTMRNVLEHVNVSSYFTYFFQNLFYSLKQTIVHFFG